MSRIEHLQARVGRAAVVLCAILGTLLVLLGAIVVIPGALLALPYLIRRFRASLERERLASILSRIPAAGESMSPRSPGAGSMQDTGREPFSLEQGPNGASPPGRPGFPAPGPGLPAVEYLFSHPGSRRTQ